MIFITHNWNGSDIAQLSESTKIAKYDIPAGYVNLTQMCQANGKLLADYTRAKSTKDFLEALSTDMGIPISKLVITIKGRGDKIPQGTWGHKEVATDLAQWVSIPFRIWANRTLVQVIETKLQPSEPQLTPESLIKICSDILAPTSLSNDLKATYLLRAVEAQYPESSNLVQKLLPGVQPKSDEEYISPTRLAQIYNDRTNSNIKAYQINLALEDAGLQTTYYTERTSTKTGKIKRTKCYSPTNLGSEYSTFMLDKAGSDKTVQLLRWKPSVLDQIAGILNNEI